VFRTLWGFFSDNADYGLRLAAAQTAGGQAAEALKTIEALRRLPEPQGLDPRIDLEEAQAAGALGDYVRESTAIGRAVERAERSGSRLLIARARLIEGRSLFNRGQYKPAEQSLTQAQEIFLEVGDRAGAAAALNSLGVVLGDQEDGLRAQKMLERSLAVSTEIGDRRAMAAASNNLGIQLKDRRQYTEARRRHEQALALRREIGDRVGAATSLNNLGVVMFEEDRLAEAAAYYRESLAATRELGDRRGEIRALHNLAIVDREMGRLAEARAEYEATLANRERIGDKPGGVVGRVELASVLLAQGHLAEARKVAEEGVKMAREIPMRNGEAGSLFQLGEIARAAGDLAEARRRHQEALAVREALNETRTILESRTALAELMLAEGRAADADREARAVSKEIGSEPAPALVIALQILLARTGLRLGDAAAAERALAVARPLAERTERAVPKYEFAMAAAEVDAARGRRDRALSQLTATCAALAGHGMVVAERQCRAVLSRIGGESR
jgi:tetratricopeptide (TPR) repeat protein